jgi:hypothetical protein
VDRIYQVFVSSTFLDLKEERAAVVSSLLQLEAMPAGMELFPAANEDAWTLIKRVIDSCDYYLLVIGGKYGSVDPETEVGYTEQEYDYAVAHSKPVLAFLHAEPDTIELGKSEKDAALREKLGAFREKVEASKHVKYWTSPEDLAGKVALSFANFRQTYPATGWIRGDAQASSEVLAELNQLRKQLEATEASLQSARTQPPPSAAGLSQGGDPVELDLIVTGQLKEKGNTDTYLDSIFGSSVTPFKGSLKVRPTWDELFSCVGPALLDEAEERALRSLLVACLGEQLGKEARDLVLDYVEREEEDKEVQRVTLEFSTDDFGTLLVQFRALGLIEKSERKRSVSDKGSYWTLTAYGDAHLTTLRAIHRGTTPREAAADGVGGVESVAPTGDESATP